MWNVKPTDLWDWDTLKAKITKYGIRNSLLIAQMSDVFMAQMLECNESVQPYKSNIYKMCTSSDQFIIVKPRLLRDLIERGLWNENMYERIVSSKSGSIQVNICYLI
jgi:ribonucleotide reductase alpha subunit